MEGMVEENGTAGGAGSADSLANASSSASGAAAHVVAVTSIVQLTLPSQAPSAQVIIFIYVNSDFFLVWFITLYISID